MSDELLNKIFEKLVSMDKRIDNMESNMATKQDVAAINERLNRIEKTTDYTTHEHHFTIVDKQLVTHAIEIEKLKNR